MRQLLSVQDPASYSPNTKIILDLARFTLKVQRLQFKAVHRCDNAVWYDFGDSAKQIRHWYVYYYKKHGNWKFHDLIKAGVTVFTPSSMSVAHP